MARVGGRLLFLVPQHKIVGEEMVFLGGLVPGSFGGPAFIVGGARPDLQGMALDLPAKKKENKSTWGEKYELQLYASSLFLFIDDMITIMQQSILFRGHFAAGKMPRFVANNHVFCLLMNTN